MSEMRIQFSDTMASPPDDGSVDVDAAQTMIGSNTIFEPGLGCLGRGAPTLSVSYRSEDVLSARLNGIGVRDQRALCGAY